MNTRTCKKKMSDKRARVEPKGRKRLQHHRHQERALMRWNQRMKMIVKNRQRKRHVYKHVQMENKTKSAEEERRKPGRTERRHGISQDQYITSFHQIRSKKDKNKNRKTSSSSSRSARPSLPSVAAPLPSVPLLQRPWPRRLSLAQLPPHPSSHDP